MRLGNGLVFKYILREPHDGPIRLLEAGTIHRDGLHGLIVRNEDGTANGELSGDRIRSWNAVAPDGSSIDNDMEPQDHERLR
jgi:hypothetical protein